MNTQRYPGLAAIGDQGAYAVTNLLMVVMVARGSSPAEFGQFSAIYLVLILGLAASRAHFGQPLLYTARPQHHDERTLVLVSVGLAIGLVGLSLLLGSSTAAMASAALPVLAYQDLLRYRYLGASRPELAFRSDFSWLIAQAATLAVLELTRGAEPLNGVAAWAIGALVATIVGRSVLRTFAGAHDGQRSLDVELRGVRRAFVADAAIAFARNQGFVLVFALVAGWDSSGAMRLCFSVLGFVPVVTQGLISAYLPRIVTAQSATQRGARDIARPLQLLSLGVGGIGLVFAVVADRVSLFDLVFGSDAWSAAQPLFLWVALLHLGFLLEAPLHVLLMGYVDLRSTVRGKGASAVTHLVFTTAGLTLSGARGGVIGMVIAEVFVLIMWHSAWGRNEPHATGEVDISVRTHEP